MAEVFTVGWMLTVMTTALCELGAAIAHFTAGGGPGPLGLLGAYLFFSALILGLLSLLLAGIVFKIRKQRPPRGVTLVAVAIAAAPAVLWLVNAVS